MSSHYVVCLCQVRYHSSTHLDLCHLDLLGQVITDHVRGTREGNVFSHSMFTSDGVLGGSLSHGVIREGPRSPGSAPTLILSERTKSSVLNAFCKSAIVKAPCVGACSLRTQFTFIQYIGVFSKWSRTFIEFSEFRESEKSMRHELGSV